MSTPALHRSWYSLVVVPVLLFLVVLPIYLAAMFFAYSDNRILPSSDKVGYRGTIPGSDTAELVYFIHISDIHVSKFQPNYLDNLKQFIDDILPAVNPRGVFASGDLTDGLQGEDRSTGRQQQEEWIAYHTTLEDAGMLNRSDFFWMDLKGNHDTYGTGGDDRFYDLYGISSSPNRLDSLKSNAWKLDVELPNSTSVYRFVGFDTTAPGGLSKPFNYFGYIDEFTNDRVLSLLNNESDLVTSKVLIGHHPVSSILGGLSSDIQVPYYLCGHIHSPHMKQRSGSRIELEVGDMKKHRNFRIMAWDHGVFSFTDQVLDDPFPSIIVTHPKDARYLSEFEPSFGTNATHVRLLVFSDVEIISVHVDFDQKAHPASGFANVSGLNLYTMLWKPEIYFKKGMHSIYVTVTDTKGRVRQLDQEFSLEGLSPTIGLSVVQASQLLGKGAPLIHQLLAIFVGLFNCLFFYKHRWWILDFDVGPTIHYIKGYESRKFTPAFKWSRALSVFMFLFFVCLLVGPYSIDKVVHVDTKSGFAFAYGVVLPDKGLMHDLMATVFWYILQIVVVFPFLLFVVLHRQEFGYATKKPSFRSLVSFLKLEHVDVVDKESKKNTFKNVVRLLLPPYMLIVPVLYLSKYIILSKQGWFSSPCAWFLYGTWIFIFQLLASTCMESTEIEVSDAEDHYDQIEIGELNN